jgi:Secretion system C-terminal sorting domain
MRKVLPFASLLLGMLSSTSGAQAQYDRFAYAITDVKNENANWNFLRKLNLQTGEYSPVLLQGNDASLLAYDALTKKQFSAPLNDERYGKTINAAFATGVAAMAFDKKNNRLYYTPMFFDQLRYIDLKTMKVYFLANQGFTGMSQKNADQGNVITRMVIGGDGNGYAMTNDGTHLIQFTTGKKLIVTDLGPLVDAQANKGISVHNSCSSFGGDMVADDDGNLYVFSARNEVFKVNIETKVATHVATISGLPANFTVNGAAVNSNNQVVVASAVESTSYFTVDAKTWAATPFKVAGTVWHSSDLANSNLLISGNKPTGTSGLISANTPSGDGKIQIYPNPVTNYKFIAEFNQLEAGKYSLQVTDVMGRQVLLQVLNISGENQTQNINLNPSLTKGIYLLKVTNHDSKAVFSTKLVVQ